MQGFCGRGPNDRPVSSTHDDCLPDLDFQSKEKNLHQCASRCARCGRTGRAADGVCRFASFSAKYNDCSLYSHCDLKRVEKGPYHSIDVSSIDVKRHADSLIAQPKAVAPLPHFVRAKLERRQPRDLDPTPVDEAPVRSRLARPHPTRHKELELRRKKMELRRQKLEGAELERWRQKLEQNWAVAVPAKGFCAATMVGEGALCSPGQKQGSWLVDLPPRPEGDAPASLGPCLQLCHACAQCNYLTLESKSSAECSWYSSCPRLVSGTVANEGMWGGKSLHQTWRVRLDGGRIVPGLLKHINTSADQSSHEELQREAGIASPGGTRFALFSCASDSLLNPSQWLEFYLANRRLGTMVVATTGQNPCARCGWTHMSLPRRGQLWGTLAGTFESGARVGEVKVRCETTAGAFAICSL